LNPPLWTIRTILLEAARLFEKSGSDTPRLDGELLLAHTLRLRRLDLYLDRDRPLSSEEREAYRLLVRRRMKGEPVAYLIGEREFFGRSFHVSPAVLIPRPDTEVVVELALGLMRSHDLHRVVDVGTGSGIIAATLALERPDAWVVGSDISSAAIAVACANGAALQAPCCWLQGSLLDWAGDQAFSLVVSNPPYIAHDDARVQKEVAAFEPHLALFSSNEGWHHLDCLLREGIRVLQPQGWLALECGDGQGEELIVRGGSYGYARFERGFDIEGRLRAVAMQRP